MPSRRNADARRDVVVNPKLIEEQRTASALDLPIDNDAADTRVFLEKLQISNRRERVKVLELAESNAHDPNAAQTIRKGGRVQLVRATLQCNSRDLSCR